MDLTELKKNSKIYITKYITVKTIIHLLILIKYLLISEEKIAIIYYIKE